MAYKEGQFDVVELMVNNQFRAFSINLNTQHVNGMTPFEFNTFSINLNAQHVNGMTPFDLAVHMYGY